MGLGITVIVQALTVHEIAMVLAGTLLSGMALFNIGCCATGTCNAAMSKNASPLKEIEYEEVV